MRKYQRYRFLLRISQQECRGILEYVRKNQDDEMDIKMAVITAIDQCLKENILVKELTAYRKEVIDMFILEHYDEEFHRRKQREEIREEIEDEAREEAEKKIYKEMIKRRQEEEEKIQKDINKMREEELKRIHKEINEIREELKRNLESIPDSK